MNSTINFIRPRGTWTTPSGDILHRFEYVFEDNMILTCFHKTEESPWKVGDSADYEVTKTHKDGGKAGKLRKPGTSYSGGGGTASNSERDERIGRQWAINAAIEKCYASSVNPPDVSYGDIAHAARELLQMRDNLDTYTGKKDDAKDDLPF